VYLAFIDATGYKVADSSYLGTVTIVA